MSFVRLIIPCNYPNDPDGSHNLQLLILNSRFIAHRYSFFTILFSQYSQFAHLDMTLSIFRFFSGNLSARDLFNFNTSHMIARK